MADLLICFAMDTNDYEDIPIGRLLIRIDINFCREAETNHGAIQFPLT